MLRVAVIGAGRIGRVHSEAIASHPQAELVLVSDPFGTAAADLAGQYGARHCLDAAEVFADPEVDAVVIGSPSTFHAEHVLAAAKAGKAVLCEKPVAITVEEGRKLEADLAALGEHPPVMLGFQRRFDPTMARAKRLLDEGKLGELNQVSIVSRDPGPPPAQYIAQSGGIWKDMAIHDFDEARFYMGEIESVTAFGQELLPEVTEAGDYSAGVVVLKAASGALATITFNRKCATGYDQRIELHGSQGSARMDNQTDTSLQLYSADFSAAREPYLNFFLTRYAAAYRNELTAFIDAINNGTPVSPTVADGVQALVLAELRPGDPPAPGRPSGSDWMRGPAVSRLRRAPPSRCCSCRHWSSTGRGCPSRPASPATRGCHPRSPSAGRGSNRSKIGRVISNDVSLAIIA